MSEAKLQAARELIAAGNYDVELMGDHCIRKIPGQAKTIAVVAVRTTVRGF